MNQKFPIIKNRGLKSREKIADSFMNVSNKIWGTMFISIITLPIAGLVKLIFMNKSNPITQSLKQYSIDSFATAYILILLLGAFFAYKLRKDALDIYDSIDPDHDQIAGHR